jgi:uncharacterized cofD-like protein
LLAKVDCKLNLMQFNDLQKKGLNVVAIGGGTGLSSLLYGLKAYVDSDLQPAVRRLSAIVAVSDDGGSSGRLRNELQMPPPGDIRNCMVALGEDSLLLSRLFQHRFRGTGDLGGHSFGNLFLAALSEITDDFAEAVRLSSEILASKGHIYPATMADVRLAAILEEGTVVRGETNISRIGPRIRRLYLEPEDCRPLPDAIMAISEADIITLGPGSLFTSLLPPLLVRGVGDAIAASRAVKVFICNLMTQPGETDGLSSRRHVEIVAEYLPQVKFDIIIVNNQPITPAQAAKYLAEGAEQIGIHGSIDESEIGSGRIVYAKLLQEGEKVRHDPARLAQTVLESAVKLLS